MPYRNSDGTPAGKVVFVATNCLNDYPLGFCRQQPPYPVQGVSSNETVYQDFLLAHENYDINGPLETTVEAMCLAGEPPFNEN